MAENPYTAPQTSVEIQPTAGTQPITELASRWARLGASLIDTVILMVIFFPLLYVVFAFGIVPEVSTSESFFVQMDQSSYSLIGTVITATLGIAVYLIVNGYLMVNSGQSIGKKALGIQIVDADTKQLLSAPRVIGLRYMITTLVVQIPMIGQFLSFIDVLFIFGQDKRCLHDLIADSIVIKKESSLASTSHG